MSISGLRAAWSGWRDGRLLIPGGDDPSPYLEGLRAEGQARAAREAERFIRAGARLQARLDARRLAAAYAKEAASHARAGADHLARQRAALQDHAIAQRLQAPMSGGGLPAWAYLLLVVGLCSLELPVVYLSFTAIGLSPVFTALLAALCSALTGLLGHSLGGLCRQLRVNRWFLLVVALVGSVAFVGALAYLRESAMEALTSETVSLNPRAAAWAFFAISFATLGVAAELAWHQPPAVLAQELAAANRAWRRAERLAHRAQARSLNATRREMQTQRAIESLRALSHQRVERLAMRVRSLMQAYVQANVRSRETNDLPPGLRPENLPAVTMPDELEQRSGTHVGTVERPA